MNESEVKHLVEWIVELEASSDWNSSQDDFSESGYCMRQAEKLEKELEQAGFLLGESGEDLIVYQASDLKVARAMYLIFDTANWCWRQPESEVA